MDTTCMTIMGGMAVGMLGLAKFTQTLYRDLQKCHEARAKVYEGYLALLKTLRDEFDK